MDGFPSSGIRNFVFMLILLFYMAVFPTNAKALSEGFTVRNGPSGTELVWTPPAAHSLRIGGTRPEFRLGGDSAGELFGYPRELDGKLVLVMSNKQRELLVSSGQELEVWSSGRRGAPGVPFTDPVPVAAKNASYVAAAITLTPTVTIDPAANGTASTQRISYNLTGLQLTSPAFPVKLEVLGEVTHPKPLVGQHPLVLFLHGRHSTCYNTNSSDTNSGDWPCPPSVPLPIPSHKGYRYIADILASQGYVVVSISANGINGQDWGADDAGTAARSILIRHHLALWAKWSTTGGDPWSGSLFKGKLDMNNVVLVGHSRGGEGVHRAAIDASPSDPFKIVGLVSYGPTCFGRQVTPDIHSVTILPTCDGDVYDLQGQLYVDSSRDIAYSEAIRSVVISLGSNHNYFNTEWTPGLSQAPSFDDFYSSTDPVCGSDGGGVRLTPKEQQVVGATYTAALVRMAVKQDAGMLQLLDGSFVRPEVIGRADVATNAVGGAAYRLLYRPEDAGSPIVGNGMTGVECNGYDGYGSVDGCGGDNSFYSPHWVLSSGVPSFPAPIAMELTWTKIGAFARFNIPNGMNNLTSLDWINVRVANDPNTDNGAQLKLVVLDKNGKNATVSATPTSVEGWPGSDILDRVHARTLQGSLDSVKSKVDLTNIVAVQLVAHGSSGRVWVIDIAASQSKVKEPKVLDLPVISIEAMTVPEGNGLKTVNVKVTANKPLKSPGTIWLEKSDGEAVLINLAAGSSTQVAQVQYTFIGDSIYSPLPLLQSYLAVAAVKGVVTGNYLGGITVVEDDPAPTLSAKASKVIAKEGKSLIWELLLSAPTTGTDLYFFIFPPSIGKELSSQDVPTSWLLSVSNNLPKTPTTLSSHSIVIPVSFDYGVTKANLIIPIASDGITEGEELIVLQGYGLKNELLTLEGKVLKHNK